MEGDGTGRPLSTRARGGRPADQPRQRARAAHARGESARWSNALQALAATTPHSIPVTVSTDPRHSFAENSGAAFAAGAMSAWPEPLGLAALAIRSGSGSSPTSPGRSTWPSASVALHPQIDLGTEPRWGRQFHTFGNDSASSADVAAAYVDGFQGPTSVPTSVATMAKHFPGGGPQLDGEDPHFPYGREQVYPGGVFDDHLLAVPPGHRGRHAAADALLRACPVGWTGAGRGGRLRLQPGGPDRSAPRAARLPRRDLHRLGSGHRHRCSAAAARPGVGRRAPHA